MERLLASFGDFGLDPRVGGADSFCDRLNCRVTVFLLAVFALMVTAKFYVGEPISCWCPGHFESSHVSYTNKFCWTTNTYILPDDAEIPDEENEHKNNYIGYYQWVSLILAFQAILFYIPRPLWRVFNKKAGMAVSTITDAAIECQRKSEMEARDKTMRYMVKHMGRFLFEICRKNMIHKSCRSVWWAIYGNSLCIMYVIVKLVYIGNVIGQLYLLNAFLGTDFNLYGIHILRKMSRGEEWTSSSRFPRVTLCNIRIRVLGDVHRYTIQCSLPMNLFNEIIFIFIWFWFAFVAAATVASLLMWLFVIIYSPHDHRYVRSRLLALDKIRDFKRQKQDLEHFLSVYLRRDGRFIVRMVGKNTSDIIAAELLGGLWDHYLENKQRLVKLSSRYSEMEGIMGEMEL